MQKCLKIVLKSDFCDRQRMNRILGKDKIVIKKTKTREKDYTTIYLDDYEDLSALLEHLNSECWWGVQVHKIKTKRLWR